MEQLLALEMVRVTEAAAIASARFMGRGDRMEADRAATEAMRRTMDEIDMAGTIVIGEGERDEAPMLYIGEQVGRPGTPTAGPRPSIDIAVDPLEGTNLVAHGQAGAITVLAASERGGLLHAPDTYLEKLCVGPGRRRPGRHHAEPDRERPPDRRGAAPARRTTSRWSSSSDRATTTSSPRSGRPAPGSSSSATATSRRPSRAPCRGPASTRSWASAAPRRA